MKRSIILTLVFLLTLSLAQGAGLGKGKEARKESKKENATVAVSINAKNNFASDFSNAANVQWSRSANFDEATFTESGHTMTAYYDSEGSLIGTTSPRKFDELPVKGQEAIKEKYKDYTIGPVIYFDDNSRNDTDMILWATIFQDEDQYFVELMNGTKNIVVQVNPSGQISFFKQLGK